MGRHGEIWGDMGRYGEIWGDMGRHGETWGDMGRADEPEHGAPEHLELHDGRQLVEAGQHLPAHTVAATIPHRGSTPWPTAADGAMRAGEQEGHATSSSQACGAGQQRTPQASCR